MTRSEFDQAIEGENIDPRCFTLDGGLPSEQYVMASDEAGYHVYYSERGQRTGMRTFASEAMALVALFADLQRDQTTRRRDV
jgi:hypothetical protein